MVLEIS